MHSHVSLVQAEAEAHEAEAQQQQQQQQQEDATADADGGARLHGPIDDIEPVGAASREEVMADAPIEPVPEHLPAPVATMQQQQHAPVPGGAAQPGQHEFLADEPAQRNFQQEQQATPKAVAEQMPVPMQEL